MRKQLAGALRRIADRLAEAPLPAIDLQVFRESGTWRKPDGASVVAMRVYGADGSIPGRGPGRDGLVVVASVIPGGDLPHLRRASAWRNEEPVRVGKGGATSSGPAELFGPVKFGGGGSNPIRNGVHADGTPMGGVFTLGGGGNGGPTPPVAEFYRRSMTGEGRPPGETP